MADYPAPKIGSSCVSAWKTSPEELKKNPKRPVLTGYFTIPEDAVPGKQYDFAIFISNEKRTPKSPDMWGKLDLPWEERKPSGNGGGSRPAKPQQSGSSGFDDDLPW